MREGARKHLQEFDRARRCAGLEMRVGGVQRDTYVWSAIGAQAEGMLQKHRACARRAACACDSRRCRELCRDVGVRPRDAERQMVRAFLGIAHDFRQAAVKRCASRPVHLLGDPRSEQRMRERQAIVIDRRDARRHRRGHIASLAADLLEKGQRRPDGEGRRFEGAKCRFWQRREPRRDHVVQRWRKRQRLVQPDRAATHRQRSSELECVERIPPRCLVDPAHQCSWRRFPQLLSQQALDPTEAQRPDLQALDRHPVGQRRDTADRCDRAAGARRE